MRLTVLGAFLSVIPMAGCLSVNPITAVQLAQLNPLEADPAAMAVQMILPPGVGVVPGTAELRLETRNPAQTPVDGVYVLAMGTGNIWRVRQEDQPLLRADQARAIAMETADPDGTSGSFGVGFEPCTTGDGPAGDARVTIRLQLAPGEAFLPVFEDTPLRRLADAEDIAALGPCD